jgi:hypothetical protein
MVLYLLPVLLVVLLVGGLAMLSGGVVRVLRSIGRVAGGAVPSGPARTVGAHPPAVSVPHHPRRPGRRLRNRSA